MQLNYHPEVKQALADGQPVVALESTLIAHGLPRPINLQVAQQLEDAVRAAGAIPATIAILKGHITVGLLPEELEYLAQSDFTQKCSRRDLPMVVARGEDGATTVAGTMLIARAAGLRVFATGGIGGVHRGQSHDVSADLTELGRTPITVVSSGAKAILDIPLTLEVLETYGVPVIGYGTPTFPAFYSRSSGCPVDIQCDTPAEVAKIVQVRDALQLTAGVLVTVPVPEADALPKEEIEEAIQQALKDADKKEISGKAVTPFLLARVSELTGARSQGANIALLLNNAGIAAKIAHALNEGPA